MMEKTIKFISENFKFIVSIIVFIIGLYIQHEINTRRIDVLEYKYDQLDHKLDNQYQKIDAIKLDKTVFEVTIQQFATMRDDIREIRNDMKEILKNK